MKFFVVFLIVFGMKDSFSQDSSKLYRFVFRAGAATGLNLYEPKVRSGIKEYSYNKVSFGTGLGTELSYKAEKFMDVVAHYYFYVYKNKVDFPSVMMNNFALKQQSHMLAVSADFKLYQKRKTKISIGTGPGFSLNKEQFVKTDAITNDVLQIGERNTIKFIAPVYIGLETYIKNYIVLGTRAQTFIWGDKHAFRTLNLFSYLGMRF